MGFLDRLPFGRKAAPAPVPRTRERMPLPRAGLGHGAFTVNADGSGVSFLNYLLVGGQPSPIQPSETGPLRLNSIWSICVNWIATSWMVAEFQVGKKQGKEFKPDERHPLPALMRMPSPTYGGKWLIWAWMRDYWDTGNAYAQILPGRDGVQELLWLPTRLVEPRPDAKGYLSHYEYTCEGRVHLLAPADVIHFRFGVDPNNPLVGVPPLESAFREVVTDNSTADYRGGQMKNGGVPPIILTPEVPKDGLGEYVLTEDEATLVEKQLGEKLKLNPGQMRVISSALKLLQLAWEPGKMGLEIIQEAPETRIPALFGIPPVVLGLRAGLQKATYNNVKEAKALAWSSCLIPLQDYFAEEISNRLLPLFPGSEGKCCRYDRSGVEELQEDQNAKREQARADHQAGIITLEEARAEGGRQTDDKIRLELEEERQARMPVLPEEDSGEDPDGDGSQPAKKKPKPPAPSGGGAKSYFCRLPLELKRTRPADIHSAIDTFRKALLAKEELAVQQMALAYDVAGLRIQKSLEALVERMEQALASGEPVSEAWLKQEQRYHELLRQVDEALGELAEEQAGPLIDAQRGYVHLAAEHAGKLTTAALGAAPEGVSLTWNRLPRNVLETFVGMASDGSPLADLLAELGPHAGEGIREALLGGIAQGQSPRVVARAISDAFEVNRARALTLCRTEMMRAARLATIHSYAANPDVVDGWIWVASIGSGEVCPCCWAMHGTEHSNSEILDDHPNGRCVAVPKTKSWAQITGDPDAPDTRPVISTGEAEFAKLSPEQQREILGPAMYELFRTGKVGLSHQVVQTSNPRWGTMRRAATLTEALAAAGAT